MLDQLSPHPKFLSSSDERLTFDAKNLFFASDYHYGHASIIQYCKRPYVSVDEMDQALSFGLQETVPHKGVMVFLGKDSGMMNNRHNQQRQHAKYAQHSVYGAGD